MASRIIKERHIPHPLLMWAWNHPTFFEIINNDGTFNTFNNIGFKIIPSTNTPSQGVGNTHPVNYGKLFVSNNRSNAPHQHIWCTNSFHLGIVIPREHPLLSYMEEKVSHIQNTNKCII